MPKGLKSVFGRLGTFCINWGTAFRQTKKLTGEVNTLTAIAQFEYINNQAVVYQNAGDPVISVDCKKKELIGEYKNSGQEWEQKGDAPKVNVYDFPDKEKGKAAPYGIYDIANN